MTETDFHLDRFDPATASDQELATLLAFTNRLRAELMPDDPPTPLAEAIAAWRITSEIASSATWLVRSSEGDILGRAQCSHVNSEENRHVVQTAIQVAMQARRRGLGRQLLAAIAGRMRETNRTLALTGTNEHMPGGAAWLERMGAERAFETHVHRLVIQELDRDALHAWQARAGERSQAFESGFWDGPYPEDQIDAIAELREVMNTQPTGTLAIEPQRYTPVLLRQVEAMVFGRGAQRLTMYVRERATGRFAGFTEVFWKASSADVLDQGDTGVLPEFRELGLGRWLKAAMLERALGEHPEIRFVRTTSADTNAAMLRLNRALGFRPYLSRTVWQVELAKIENYLRASGWAASAAQGERR